MNSSQVNRVRKCLHGDLGTARPSDVVVGLGADGAA